MRNQSSDVIGGPIYPQNYKAPQNIEQDKQQLEQQLVSFSSLFRFADGYDYVLIIVGTASAIATGTGFPIFALFLGNVTDSFIKGGQQMVNVSRQIFYRFIITGFIILVLGGLMFGCWMITGKRQSLKCRQQYLKSLLRQEIGWFDMQKQTQISSKFSADCFAFQGAIGEKISNLLMLIGTFIAGFTISFIQGWQMTLVMISTIPALGVAGYFYISAIEGSEKKQQNDYSQAAAKAQEAISAIKTVKMLNGEQFQIKEYSQCIEKAAANTLKYGIWMGMGLGSLFMILFGTYALGFWWGSKLVERDLKKQNTHYTAGIVLTIFFSVIQIGYNLTQLSPCLIKITQGRLSATRIYRIIDRVPVIKNSENPIIPQKFKGLISLKGVTFSYPKQKDKLILNNLTMQLNMRNIAIVGESGCGKSTILQLIMRFYDPDEGIITIDGIDIKHIDIKWLRKTISYVPQEPFLFATTIRQNILFGQEDVSETEIISALIKAQAYDFVQLLHKKLDTYVGYGGGQLSGGQKQRIAIARALVKQPKILLLDEATSALDRLNQKRIKQSLKKISEQIMCITVAHRVKTIIDCDMIYVMDKGMIIQKGKWKEIEKYSKYENLNEQEEIDEGNSIRQQIPIKKGFNHYIQQTIATFIRSQQRQDEEESMMFMNQQEKKKKQQKLLLQKYQQKIFFRIFSYSFGQILCFAVGIICSLGNGTLFPIFTVFFSSMLTLLLNFKAEEIKSRQQANRYTLIFFIIGIVIFIGISLQVTMFHIVGTNITNQIRKQTYAKIMKMQIKWFDQSNNSVGKLCTRLSKDCHRLNGLTTINVGIIIQNISTIITAIIIAFVYEWRIALIALGLIPLMIVSGLIEMNFTVGFSDKTDEQYRQSSELISQAIMNIRSVTSFGYDSFTSKLYGQKLKKPFQSGIKKAIISAFLFGFSQFILYFIVGLIFFLGAIIVRDNYSQENLVDGVNKMLTAIYTVVFGAVTAGSNAHFMHDISLAKQSAASIFSIQDQQGEQENQIKQNSAMLTEGIQGEIRFDNVSFKYEDRTEDAIKNLSFKFCYGQKIGIAGVSGCGKSTIFQLLIRFYEPYEGKITINNIDIKQFSLQYLRQSLVIVSQQPFLFNSTIKKNIKYNIQSTDEEMYQAAVKADAISFILGDQKLGQSTSQEENELIKIKGFQRNVGAKGSHISGGQKQRIAIARAILRNPKFLLLDEATSALGNTNEKRILTSIDMIMKEKTVISIAHRIETLREADEIMVLEKGKIMQQGSYNRLISNRDYLYKLEKGSQSR